jgi:hypothetical protein
MGKYSYVTVQVKSKKYKLITTDLRRVYRVERTQYPPIPIFRDEK